MVCPTCTIQPSPCRDMLNSSCPGYYMFCTESFRCLLPSYPNFEGCESDTSWQQPLGLHMQWEHKWWCARHVESNSHFAVTTWTWVDQVVTCFALKVAGVCCQVIPTWREVRATHHGTNLQHYIYRERTNGGVPNMLNPTPTWQRQLELELTRLLHVLDSKFQVFVAKLCQLGGRWERHNMATAFKIIHAVRAQVVVRPTCWIQLPLCRDNLNLSWPGCYMFWAQSFRCL